MDTLFSNSGIINRDIYYGEFENGLRCILMPMKNFKKKYCIYLVDYGANDINYYNNSKKVSTSKGIAHFLEHKMFEQKGEDAFGKFSKIGAYSNAYTSHTSTAYLFETTESFYKGLEILLSFLTAPAFSKEGVEKEKDIIRQELDMYKDDADWMVYFNLLSCMYKDHPLTFDMVGTEESLANITKEELMKCYRSFYTGNNSMIISVGDLDNQEFFKEIENLNTLKKENNEKIVKENNKTTKGIVKQFNKYSLPVAKPIFSIGIKDDFWCDNVKNKVEKSIIMDMGLDILFGASSNCFNELYQKQMIDAPLNPGYNYGRDYGFSIMGGTSHSPKQVVQRINQALKEVPNVTTKEALDRARLRYKSNIIKALDNPSEAAAFLSECFTNQVTPMEYMDLVQYIELERVIQSLEQSLNRDNLCLSVVSDNLTL
jgi:predicted Zn-dependent peptidase